MTILQGNKVIAGRVEDGTKHYLGQWILTTTSGDIIPEGCMKPDGFEQLDAPNSMFADLWNYALTPSEDWGGKTYLDTCTYEEYYNDIKEYGACAKWAVDYSADKFKLPFVPDGYYFKAGQGTVNKAGLPNITGQLSSGSYGPSYAGAFQYAGFNSGSSPNPGGATGVSNFDASRSNPIYGKSDTVETDAIGLHLFIYVANATIGDFTVNWNKMQNAITSKANGKFAVVEAKINPDGSWYRKWSDGWVEQGGRVYAKQNSTITISLVYPLINNIYQVFTNPEHVSQDIWGYGQTIPSKTNTNFQLYIHNSAGSYNTAWYACGQGA